MKKFKQDVTFGENEEYIRLPEEGDSPLPEGVPQLETELFPERVSEERKAELQALADNYYDTHKLVQWREEHLNDKENTFSGLSVVTKGLELGEATFNSLLTHRMKEITDVTGSGKEGLPLPGAVSPLPLELEEEIKTLDEQAEIIKMLAKKKRDYLFQELEKERNPIKRFAGTMAAYMAKVAADPVDLGTMMVLNGMVSGAVKGLGLGPKQHIALRASANFVEESTEELREQTATGSERSWGQAGVAGVAGAVMGEAIDYIPVKAKSMYKKWMQEGQDFPHPEGFKTEQAVQALIELKTQEATTGVDKTSEINIDGIFTYNGQTLPHIRSKADMAKGRALINIYQERIKGREPQDPGRLFLEWNKREEVRNVARNKVLSLKYYDDKVKALDLWPQLEALKTLLKGNRATGKYLEAKDAYEVKAADDKLYHRKSKTKLAKTEAYRLKMLEAEAEAKKYADLEEGLVKFFDDNYDDILELEMILRQEVAPGFGVYDLVTQYHPALRNIRTYFYDMLTHPKPGKPPIKHPERLYLGIELIPYKDLALVGEDTYKPYDPTMRVDTLVLEDMRRRRRGEIEIEQMMELDEIRDWSKPKPEPWDVLLLDELSIIIPPYKVSPIGGPGEGPGGEEEYLAGLEEDVEFWEKMRLAGEKVETDNEYLIEYTPEEYLPATLELKENIKEIEKGIATVDVDTEVLKEVVFKKVEQEGPQENI